jgi:hypothetical protein
MRDDPVPRDSTETRRIGVLLADGADPPAATEPILSKQGWQNPLN